jgi:hypothetical protein
MLSSFIRFIYWGVALAIVNIYVYRRKRLDSRWQSFNSFSLDSHHLSFPPLYGLYDSATVLYYVHILESFDCIRTWRFQPSRMSATRWTTIYSRESWVAVSSRFSLSSAYTYTRNEYVNRMKRAASTAQQGHKWYITGWKAHDTVDLLSSICFCVMFVSYFFYNFCVVIWQTRRLLRGNRRDAEMADESVASTIRSPRKGKQK